MHVTGELGETKTEENTNGACKLNSWDFFGEIHFVCMQNNLILTDIISKLGLLDYYECALLHKLLRPAALAY